MKTLKTNNNWSLIMSEQKKKLDKLAEELTLIQLINDLSERVKKLEEKGNFRDELKRML